MTTQPTGADKPLSYCPWVHLLNSSCIFSGAASQLQPRLMCFESKEGFWTIFGKCDIIDWVLETGNSRTKLLQLDRRELNTYIHSICILFLVASHPAVGPDLLFSQFLLSGAFLTFCILYCKTDSQTDELKAAACKTQTDRTTDRQIVGQTGRLKATDRHRHIFQSESAVGSRWKVCQLHTLQKHSLPNPMWTCWTSHLGLIQHTHCWCKALGTIFL